ncbi:glycine cleavage system protein R [Kiritimatiella glycovorans]|uniref:Glycine cleavage system transcriptional repressor n=1 Tax=Kiritimatiella glycovorans TaxID=1307763 RepID=A0A0G3EIB7_9BACT|nr:ACT domain-containing protein [Kiritimatiella glycovorans]AKJ65182.1 glycine cleavage system transcriptional repressor [Kiritimatiella glycovorans]
MDDRRHFVISILSRDRVGIVADVTGVIRDLGGDLADLSQTVLCGYFTMILAARFPAGVEAAQVRERLEARGAETGEAFDVGIRVLEEELPADAAARDSGGEYVLTAVGPNRSGLVACVSSFCREHGINILDLATTLAGENYTMILLLDLSPVDDPAALRTRLEALGEEAGLSVVLQHRDIFKATHEIREYWR